MVSSVVLLALASVAAAITVTSPSSDSVWKVGEDQTVTWSSVSTDEDSFDIYLSNMANYPTTTILLVSGISSSAGSASIDGSMLTAGDSFTINFTNGTKTEQIYAQSNQFDIEEGSASSSSSSAASTASSTSSAGTATSASTSAPATTLSTSAPANSGTGSSAATATATDSASTASATASASGSGGASSSATGSSASSSTAATSGAGKIVAGWMGVIALAVMAL